MKHDLSAVRSQLLLATPQQECTRHLPGSATQLGYDKGALLMRLCITGDRPKHQVLSPSPQQGT